MFAKMSVHGTVRNFQRNKVCGFLTSTHGTYIPMLYHSRNCFWFWDPEELFFMLLLQDGFLPLRVHTRAFEWNIALNRIVFSLWAVSAKSNFSVADLASKQSTQRAIFLFCSNLSTQVWFLCASCNSLVAFSCMWALFVSPWRLWLCYKLQDQEHQI